MPKEVPEIEKKTIAQINTLLTDFKKQFWVQYYFISPAKVFVNLAFHSNLSLYIFQKTYRGNWLMEIWRFVCFVIHSLAFCFLLLGVLVKQSFYKKAVLIVLLAYVGYLIFFQRGIEERYTLPILSIVLISFAKTIEECYEYIYAKYQNKIAS